MSKFVVFRPRGENDIWLADLESETLQRMSPDAMTATGVASDLISVADRARGSDLSIVKDMDFAVAASQQSAASSHELYKRPHG